ncbi:BLUF domain-containing protein [Thiocystis violacea]|uniref:BLUF domain-containing protein n=1 Tax=Thiocystis violacea TaxID=13725 RepID=UPI0019066679|nr:BLUF domain-containing protein [Thiocystis violacea]MBK1719365.1 hypothetical protein [Thiocystis violacea]
MTLIHLIYVSSAREDLSEAELDKILASSVRHNKPQSVTGMLLYSNGSFMQVLEGDAVAVDEVFSRIRDDPRHTAVFVIERAPISERNFDRWSMGFKRLDARDAAAYRDYAPFFEHGFDAAHVGARPSVALEMLINFARDQDRGVAVLA